MTRFASELTVHGVIKQWADIGYEPEIHAFGGPAAMAVAHNLFSADSHIWQRLAAHRDSGADDRPNPPPALTTFSAPGPSTDPAGRPTPTAATGTP